jgi:hypothetical protein
MKKRPSYRPHGKLVPTLSMCLGLLLFAACAPLQKLFSEDDPDQRRRCGEGCLRGGQQCSVLASQRLEWDRQQQAQSIQNYRICLKKFPEALDERQTPCVRPLEPQPVYDACGENLEVCLKSCNITLEELASGTVVHAP